MKEKEINALATPWANASVAHLLVVCRMTAVKVGDGIVEELSPDDYDQVVFTQNVENIGAFSSRMVPVKLEKAYTRRHINIMTQALWTGDGTLLQGLIVQNMYTELRQGSKNAVMVVRNSTAYPQTLQKKTPVARGSGSNPNARTTNGSPVPGSGEWVPGSSYPQIDCQAKALKIIWWTGFEQVRLLASRASRCSQLALAQVTWCVFIGPHRVRLSSLYWTHNKSNRWHSL